MSRTTIGWIWVAGQAVLLGALILIPGGDDWATPGWLELVAGIAFFGGLAIVGIASLRLGRSLTPTPVPATGGALATGGLYRWVRHPIYTGVILIVVAIAMRSGSLWTVAVAVVTLLFFNAKAGWEERRLADRYPDYPAYAAITPRFVPLPWRLRRM